jgi:16S rRNA (cytosine967-C5)-methyltransferase
VVSASGGRGSCRAGDARPLDGPVPPEPRAAKSAEEWLAAGCHLLRRWEDGITLKELLGFRPPALLQNALFTLFRQRGAIDWLIAQAAARPVRPRLLTVLRWALSDILYGRRLPAAIMTDVAVAYVRRCYSPQEAHFVNAMLRRLVTAGPAALLAQIRAEAPPAVRLGLSPELYRVWAKRFAAAELERLAQLLQEPAPLWIRVRGAALSPAVAAHLDAPTEFPAWAGGCELRKCRDPEAFFAATELRTADFYVQDPSTLAAPILLAVQPGERVADLCAAPGGKSLILAERLAGAGTLVCADRSPGRVRRLRENSGDADRVLLAVADAAKPPFAAGTFDAVLLDVPCSNTGVIRRRPDVRWRFSPARAAELGALQFAILAGAAPLVKHGGRLVYSTCSIEPAENRQLVNRFLAAHPAFRFDREIALLPQPEHDGAYAALLLRNNG